MSIKILNLSTYTSPKVIEIKNQDFVSYGQDNNFFQFLIDRFNGSPTNNAAINGISQLIYGKGLDALDSNKKPDEYAKMKAVFAEEDVQRVVNDFYLLGQGSVQVVYNKEHTKIEAAYHFPIETLRAEKANEEGEIEAYYYFPDWTKYKKGDVLKRIPAFGFSKEGIEIYYIKPYKTGFYYYSPVAYQGGLQYCELEEEISNYHLNNILNGLAPSMLINFNNGIPDDSQRTLIENSIQEKFSGTSNAGKFILAFNDSAEQQATIEPVQLSDAHQQYQFLSDESMRKIMVAHRIISPMLMGIKDSTGLGNNAEEIQTASTLMDNTVIRPYQNIILKCFDNILAVNDIALNLYFKTLQPLEFTDLENAVTKEQVEEETGQKLSLSVQDVDLTSVFEELNNVEQEDFSEWVLVDERKADAERENQINRAFNFAQAVKGSPNDDSIQDTSLFRVRYKYAPTFYSSESRDFCRKMVNASRIYRLEDIDRDITDNPGFGEGGSNSYNCFLYKGGAQCKHFWMRQIYMLKDNDKISVNEARRIINELDPSERPAAKWEVNPYEVAQLPFDMENRGYVNPPAWLK